MQTNNVAAYIALNHLLRSNTNFAFDLNSLRMWAGLICLEYYKVCQKKPLEAFRCGFVNLALPFVGLGEPIGVTTEMVPRADGSEWKWSLWDALEIDNKPDMTLSQVQLCLSLI